MRTLLLIVVAICLCAGSSLAMTYEMHDLGVLGDDFHSYATAINNSGQIIGDSWSSTIPGLWHPFIWQNGVMTELSTDGAGGAARGINDSGQIVGSLHTSGACLWENGVRVDLGMGAGSMACAINNDGTVIGEANWTIAWVWRNGGTTSIGAMADASVLMPRALNNLGQVSFCTTDGTNNTAPIVWQDGVASQIQGLSNVCEITGINDHGDIVGTTSNYHAFVCRDGVVTNLSQPHQMSKATAINNKGQVVGYVLTPELHYHAALWQDGVLTDLGTLGGWDSQAWAINDKGWIVGSSATGMAEHAVLWVPIPEPTSILGVFAGLLLMFRSSRLRP